MSLDNRDLRDKEDSTYKQRGSHAIFYLNKNKKTKEYSTLEITKKQAMPRSIVIGRNGEIIAKPLEDSNYTLIDIYPGNINAGFYNYDYRGVALAAYMVEVENNVYVYYKHDQYAMYTRTDIYPVLNSALAEEYEFYYNQPACLDNVFTGIKKDLQQVYKYNEKDYLSLKAKMCSSKFINVSAEYQQHFRPEEILSVLTLEERELIMPMNRLGVDIGAAGYAGIIVWLLSLDTVLYNHIIATRLLDSRDYVEFCRLGKEISLRAKRFQNNIVTDLKTLFEVDVLVNRVHTPIDWAAEKRHREEVDVANVDPNQVYNTAYNVFTTQRDNRNKFNRMSWKDFWDTRWEWCAAGAVHSQYASDNVYISKVRDFKNKNITINSMMDMDINEFLNKEPEIHCNTSIKYEWGKQRAIYGTDLRSYILTTFAFQNCEDLLPNQFLIGDQARESLVSAKLGSTLYRKLPFCIDFADFNSQHSFGTMEAVMWAFYDVHKHKMTTDQQRAYKWVVDSMYNTKINDNVGLKQTYVTKGTLMSGWRLTSWMNSVCNYVYLRSVVDADYNTSRSVHSGDDILYAVNNFKQVTDLIKKSAMLNIRLSRHKCNFASVAEFLRVDHAAGTYGQYLPRGIATLIHSRMESQPAYDIRDVTEATNTRMNEFVLRGGKHSLAVRLRDYYLRKISANWTNNRLDLQIMRITHRVQGGVSQEQDAPIDFRITRSIRRDKISDDKNLDLKLHGVAAYAKYVIKKSPLELDFLQVYKYIRKRTVEAYQKASVQYEIRPATMDELSQAKVYRGIYGAYSNLKNNAQYGRAKLIGKTIEVIDLVKEGTALNMIITNKDKMLETLSVLV